ncbi:PAS domain-containing sensor histidine kinase [Falsiroseomonas selenitidurans]|uniref:histidine kinase n=1 Tax=Falsiroseomonas selenitidurans TaxID=2716335 RepID=A0ABX1E392_9PROT|nr:PAS domain S-box protein [Falsiroseomonas selenitidurans]NKC31228.1 PAS domain S-box protein [Falsiroseomonas selenitidurans]
MQPPPAEGAGGVPAEVAQFQLFAEAMPAMLWIGDAEGRCVYLNAALRAFWGVASAEGFTWEATLHPEDAADLFAVFDTSLRDRTAFVVEARYRHASGTYRYLRTEASPRFGPEGRFLGMMGVNVDVTEMRAAEAAARESEARLRAMFDASPFAVFVLDPVTHRILDVNERACRDYGYSHAEFCALRIGDIDVLGDATAIRARGRCSVVGPSAQEFEARHRTRDGTVRDVLVRAQGIRVGGRDLTYGAHMDITARKQAEAALRNSQARLRLALEAAEFGTWEYDIRADQASRRGLLAEDFPELTEGFNLQTWLAPIHPEDRQMLETRLREVIEGRTARYDVEFRLVRPDGGWRWIASRGTVVETDPATGAPLVLAGVARDVTEVRRAQERQALLAREVDHRAKNALAVVQAALRLTRAPDLPSYIRAIEGRVAALARTQTLLAESRWSGADLRTLLDGEIAPFVVDQRVALSGPAVGLSPGLAQGLAMAVHELATNALKHGALSVLGGHVAIAWRLHGAAGDGQRLNLSWTEAGGPKLAAPPQRRGFGSRVLEATVAHQLGGTVTLDWQAEGLVCTLDLPLHPRRQQAG